MVYFVGAGPGAVDLITVRGKKLVEEADVIIYAGSLVNKEILEWAKKDAIIYNSATMTLKEVINVVKVADEKNMMTVRLHTGDSSIYGAIKEQMDELDALGIKYDICPGVSSFCGAAASLQVEYTLPNVSQSVIITRVKGKTDVLESERLSRLANNSATIILFLSSGLPDTVKEELLLAGRDKNTAVAIVYRATWPDERIYRTTIDKLPELMKRENITKQALIIVGDVVSAAPDYKLSKLYDENFATEYRKVNENSNNNM